MNSPLRMPAWRRLRGMRLACALAVLTSVSPHPPSALASHLEVDSTPHEDHNHLRLSPEAQAHVLDVSAIIQEGDSQEDPLQQNPLQYEADFLGVDAGILGKRALADHEPVISNIGYRSDIRPGGTMLYQMEKGEVFAEQRPPGSVAGLPSVPFASASTSANEDTTSLLARQSVTTRTVYISVNTCIQPQPNGTFTGNMPQLTLYVSTSSSNTNPGPGKDSSTQLAVPLDEGFAATKVSVSADAFFSVHAPNMTAGSTNGDPWTYEISASIDAYYHGYGNYQQPGKDDPLLLPVDSVSNSALLVTQNLTSPSTSAAINEKWMEFGNPFTLFAFANASLVQGVMKSYCGLKMASQGAAVNSNSTITTRGLGGLPKGQFYLQNLESATTYTAMMAMNGNSTNIGDGVVGGGGVVWKSVKLATNQESSACALLFDLHFCSQVAYSVPTSPQFANDRPGLSSLYDNNTASLFQNFTYSMQQIACTTTDSARYSLTSSCDDCSDAYKNWLCAVTIPRCSDFVASVVTAVANDPQHTAQVVESRTLMPRSLGQTFANGSAPDLSHFNVSGYADLTARSFANSSRNPLIDQTINPGPYMEFLPCEDLCHALVRSCPASMGFACPVGNGLRRSYGAQGQCNNPGAVFVQSGAGRTGMSWIIAVTVAVGTVSLRIL